jgi:hypothetical protein
MQEYDPIYRIVSNKIVENRIRVKFNYFVKRLKIDKESSEYNSLCYRKGCVNLKCICNFNIEDLTTKLIPELKKNPFANKWRLKIHTKPQNPNIESIKKCFTLENFYVEFDNGQKLW